MNKFVYLFELDSVRNSRAQVEIAQKALFEEIVKNGNIVVLSFNQLADSKGFLAAVANENGRVFDDILELFKKGYIRVSQFRHLKGPSQYLQNQFINHPDFIFSMYNEIFPADYAAQYAEVYGKKYSAEQQQSDYRYCIDCIRNAMQFSDFQFLDHLYDYLFSEPVPSQSQSLCSRYLSELQPFIDSCQAFMRRYLTLILTLSSTKLTQQPAFDGGFSFVDVMGRILHTPAFLEKSLVSDSVRSVLEQVDSTLGHSVNNRSSWITELKLLKEREPEKRHDICVAQMVVDLCYNYTVESSIYNVSRHYKAPFDDSFWQDFVERLEKYYEEWKQNVNHCYESEDEIHLFSYGIKLSFWHTANRVSQKIKKNDFEGGRYEDHRIRDLWRNNLRLAGINMRIFATVIIFFMIFTVLAILMNFAQDNVQQMIYDVLNGGDRDWGVLFLFTVLFSLISSIIGNTTGLPDILDTVINFGLLLYDYVRIVSFKRGYAWRNHVPIY